MDQNKSQTKVAAACRLIQSAIARICECGCEAAYLVSMNVLKEPERRFVCAKCFDALPKAAPFENASRAWLRPGHGDTRDIRMVNHAHSVGRGSGLTSRFTSRGNGTASLNFDE
jgi:hypothetical protein